MSAGLRWFAVSVFFFTSALNYLDRQLLAALAPTIQQEFGLGLEDYGLLISAFSLVYALSSPVMGLWIDRLGLTRGTSFAVGLWSLAGAATGLVSSFPGLIACRSLLGFAEAGGIPATAKASALYLHAKERALGSAVSQLGLSLGSIAAPLIAAWSVQHSTWRSAFVVTGLAGLLWIPLGIFTARRFPAPEPDRPKTAASVGDVVRARAFWMLMLSNILAMVIYSLWTNWTTVFFVANNGLSATEANQRFAWIPPVFASVGGFAGGALAHRLMSAGMPVLQARLRIALGCAAVLLATAAAPHVGSAYLAAAILSLSFAASTAMSVNIYSIPLDLFGAGRAAFATSALTASYGVLQTIVSPGIGWMVRHQGFTVVCAIASLTPLAAVALLWWAVGRRAPA